MLKKQGFTQIDLVVSLAMAAVVSAMALPTVQEAREKSKQEMCAQRVTRFTMASLEYQEVNGTVPPCTTGEVINTIIPDILDGNVQDQQQSGAIAYLLPFIERQDLFELLPAISTRPELTMADSRFMSLSNLFADPDFTTVINAQVPEWICPANPNLLDASVSQVVAGIELFSARQNNAAFPNAFPLNSAIIQPPTTEFGRTSYLPVMGSHAATLLTDTLAFDFIDSFGPFRNRTSSIATDDLGDGASNTLFWSESLGDILPAGSDFGNDEPFFFTAHSSVLHGGLLTGWGLAFLLADQGPVEFRVFGNAEQSSFWHVGSNHPGGNNVSLSDGSVKFLSDRTDRRVYTLLGAGNDGVYDNRE